MCGADELIFGSSPDASSSIPHMANLSLRSIEQRFSFLKKSSLISDYFCPRIVYQKKTIEKMGYFGQYGQDLALETFLRLLPNKPRFNFIEIGAHDGITFSNSKFLDSKENWSGICIEANPSVFEELIKNRPTSTCLNVAVSNLDGEAAFQLNTGHTEMLSGLISSYSRKHRKRVAKELKKYGGTSKIHTIPSLTLETIVANEGIGEIDILMIDVEGGEFSILKSIDFAKITVNSILVERNYSSRPVYQFLLNNGFSRLVSLGGDDLYFSNELLRPSKIDPDLN